MTPKEALKGIKLAIAEHLHKQTGVSVEKHFEYLTNDTEISIVEQALNELERLKKFKETFDNYELAKKQDFISYENWLECEKELETLKKSPTVEEVCKALSEYSNTNVYYSYGGFFYRKEQFYNQPFLIANKYKSGLIEMTKNVLPPHLITLIGRFYQSLEVK